MGAIGLLVQSTNGRKGIVSGFFSFFCFGCSIVSRGFGLGRLLAWLAQGVKKKTLETHKSLYTVTFIPDVLLKLLS
jgi:hypothetical protein